MHIYKFGLLAMLIILLTACDFDKNNDAQYLNKAQCKPNLPCTFSSGVKVWLNEQALSPETPFTIFSDLPNGLHITDARLKGISMYMGYIPQQFTKQGNIWQSNTMVGICSERNMLWELEFTVADNTTLAKHTHSFYFYVTY